MREKPIYIKHRYVWVTKDRECVGCGKRIPKGEPALVVTLLVNEEVERNYTCKYCHYVYFVRRPKMKEFRKVLIAEIIKPVERFLRACG